MLVNILLSRVFVASIAITMFQPYHCTPIWRSGAQVESQIHSKMAKTMLKGLISSVDDKTDFLEDTVKDSQPAKSPTYRFKKAKMCFPTQTSCQTTVSSICPTVQSTCSTVKSTCPTVRSTCSTVRSTCPTVCSTTVSCKTLSTTKIKKTSCEPCTTVSPIDKSKCKTKKPPKCLIGSSNLKTNLNHVGAANSIPSQYDIY